MTTDTVRKECSIHFQLGGREVTLGGMTKGAGMIHPKMGTMLCFLTTDARVSQKLLQKALLSAVQDSFNMISVDGDMSTNDTCLLMANGLAGNPEIVEEDDDYQTFCEAVGTLQSTSPVRWRRTERERTRSLRSRYRGHLPRSRQ